MKSKRENLLSPSSSWRENHHSCMKKNVNVDGCLPGFFHILFSKFHFAPNRRKCLTYGSKKREQRIAVSDFTKETDRDASSSDTPPLESPADLYDLHAPPAAAADARLNLIGALEKCDRDLAALQKTIDTIKTALVLHHKLPIQIPVLNDVKCSKNGDVVHKQTHSQKKKTEEEEEEEEDSGLITRHVAKPNINVNIVSLKNTTINEIIKRASPSSSNAAVRRVSKSMVESVNQVCADVAWGERREVGRIGLALQNHICKDLIDETVTELSASGCFRRVCSLPLDACRRRLVF